MRLRTPWNSNPLAALLQVRAQRRPQRLPSPVLAGLFTGSLGLWIATCYGAHYGHYLGLLFAALFFAIPGALFQRDTSQLKSLREGRCLEELLSVGLTPEAIADTLTWETCKRLSGLALVSWGAAIVPTFWLGDPVLLSSGCFGLLVGLLLMGLGAYLRQILLVLAESPSRLLREGLKLYGVCCLCLAPALHFYFYENALLGLQFLMLGMLCLLGWVRRRAIREWRQDLSLWQFAKRATKQAWGSWLTRFCSHPILVRELQASRGQSLWMWAFLPFAVVASVGVALPGLISDFGVGSGFLMLWLAWRLYNFSALSERARGLVQKERQGGSWELLLQVGLGGRQFVRGWFLATCFRHFGWILADLTGLLVLAHLRPEWMLPGASSIIAQSWALSLWGLGLLMDGTAFLTGLANSSGPDSRPFALQNGLLPSFLIATALGELGLLLLVSLGWLPGQGQALEFAWRQGIPCLALFLVMIHFALRAGSQVTHLLDPLRPAESGGGGCERLPQFAVGVAWISWVVSSPTLSPWRDSVSLPQFLLLLGLGHLLWTCLYHPLAWALYPLRSGLSLRSGSARWLSGMVAGVAVAAVSAVPVVLAAESLHLYWMFSGTTLAGLDKTFLAFDLPRVFLWTLLATWTHQALAVRTPELRPFVRWSRLRRTAFSVLALVACGWWSIGRVFPTQLQAQEKAWWDQVQSRLISSPQSSVRCSLWERLYDQLDQQHWALALETSLQMDRVHLQQSLAGVGFSRQDWEVGAGWLTMVHSLDGAEMDPTTLGRMADTLRPTLGMQKEQELIDEDFARRLRLRTEQPHFAFRWWPRALEVAQIRRHLERSGRPGLAAPVWADAHSLYRPEAYDQLNLYRAWRTLFLHRLEMAQGGPEWPQLYVSPNGLMFRVTVDPKGATTYRFVDQSTAQKAAASWLVRECDSSLGLELYTVSRPEK